LSKFGFAAAFALAVVTGVAAAEDLKTGFGAADNGHLVQVRGVIDACLPDACFICPDWEKAARTDEAFRRTGCLTIMRWKDTYAGLLLDELYRFSDVEIRARFRFKPAEPDDVNVLCLDFRRCPQSGLDEVTIVTLYERRPVQAVPDYDLRDSVVPIGPEDDAALRKLIMEDPDFSLVYLDGPETEVRTYMRPPVDTGSHTEGWLCFARKSVAVNPDEPFPWPTSYRAVTLRSPANPYRCRLAWKEKGTWRIIRELQKLPVYGLD
jgi:hypothetical protein